MTSQSDKSSAEQQAEEQIEFPAVFDDEIGEIQTRRAKLGRQEACAEIKRSLVGIALSGGGIRSATFCLGLLQAFENRKLLGRFDYMSTVSGGGFVGGWWSAWLARKGTHNEGDNLFPTQETIAFTRASEEKARRAAAGSNKQTDSTAGSDKSAADTSQDATAAGADPTHHLRLYANYLTPRKGMMSGDTWRFVTFVLRNLTITWAVLLPALVALILAGQLFFVIQPNPAGTFIDPNPKNTLPTPEHHHYRHLGALVAMKEEEKKKLGEIDIKKISGLLSERLRLCANMRAPAPDSKSQVVPAADGKYFGNPELPSLQAYVESDEYQRDDLREALKKCADAGTLKMIDDLEPPDMARARDLSAQIVSHEMERDELHEKAREAAMQARLVNAGLGLAPLAACVLLLSLLYLVLTTEPRIRATLFLMQLFSVSTALALFIIFVGSCAAKYFPGSAASKAFAWANASLCMPAGKGERCRVNTLFVWLEALLASGALIYALRKEMFPKSSDGAERHRWAESLRVKVSLVQTMFLVALVVTAVVLLVAGFGHELFDRNSYSFTQDAAAYVGGTAIITAAVAGALLLAYWARPAGGGERREATEHSRKSRIVLAVTPPLVVLGFALTTTWVAHGLLEQLHNAIKLYQEGERKEGARLAIVLPTVVGYCAIVAAFVYSLFDAGLLGARDGRGRLASLLRRSQGEDWREFLRRLIAYAALLVLLVVLAWHAAELVSVVLAAMSSHEAAASHSTEGRFDSPTNLWMWGAAGAALVLWLLRRRWSSNRGAERVATAALILLVVYAGLSSVPRVESFNRDNVLYGQALLGMIVTTVALIVALGWTVDPNAFSMHGFYKTRLVRAYMGASNHERGEHGKEITEPDQNDDVVLSDLKNCREGAPYHVVNTTLNLTAARDLATSQRSSEPFMLTQRFCGSVRTGYKPTDRYMKGRLTLGAAVAVSGAAASPNMGALTQSAALAMVMTLFNIRLGLWVPTPNKSSWESARARLWPFYLFREFLSRTNELEPYCYLTDGGHFDNTGLYSLVQRGCRHIVVADCTADPHGSFSDLGAVIRRCRIDFGAEISLNIFSMIRRRREERDSQTPYYAVGSVEYDRRHIGELRKGGPPADEDLRGSILYIKPALPSPEKLADVLQYQFENREFPHQSTLNQWFGEAQYESYRRLGYACGRDLLDKLGEQRAGADANSGFAELFATPTAAG